MKRAILVVDDDRDMVRTLCDILRLRGWEPRAAYSGEEAVKVACGNGAPLVLMDIRMPGMNGLDALKEIKECHPEARVILMTADSAADLIDEAERGGALRVVPKPIDLAALLPLLE